MGIGANEEPEVWQMIHTGDLKYSCEADERVTGKSGRLSHSNVLRPVSENVFNVANEMVAFNEQPLSCDAQRQSHQLHEDSLGRTTAYTYDSKGNPTSVTPLSGTGSAVTQFPLG